MQRTLAGLVAILALLSACAAPVEPALDAPEEPEAAELEVTPEALADTGLAETLLPHGLHLVLQGAGHAFVVLAVASPEAPSFGPIEWVSQDDASPQTYRALLEGADEQRARALSERYILFGVGGELCRVEADDLGVLRRAGFEQSYQWREQNVGREPSPDTAWELEGQSELLVARVGALPAACQGALWAGTERAQPKAVFAAETGSDPVLAARALARFRELDEHAAIQGEYVEAPPEGTATVRPVGPWDQYEGAAPTTSLFRDRASGRRLVLISATAGQGCGDFGGSLGALFEARSGELIVRAVQQGDGAPSAVVDADGDGNFELFTPERATFVSDGERGEVDVSVPSTGCGC